MTSSPDDADSESPGPWETIAAWLRQHPRGRELLVTLTAATGQPPDEAVTQLTAMSRLPGAPPTLVAVVEGGYVGKLVQIAQAETVNVVVPAPLSVPVPAQLPSTPPDFVNRTAELDLLHRTLRDARPDGRVLAICGPAGTGKSALAIRFAYQVLAEFADAQLYADLRGADATPADPAEVLERFLHALGIPQDQLPPTTDGRQALYRSVLSRRRALIVLDNVSEERQVRPLMPAGPDCLVLVTSRSLLGGLDVAELILLEPLSADHSLELLARMAGHERIAAEDEAARQVAMYCGYLPLSLRIAGARLRSRPGWRVSDLADRLRDQRRRLDELHVGDRSVRASFMMSYSDLAQVLARAFCLLGQAPGFDFGLPAAAAALGGDVRVAERTLEMLVDAAMLETPAAGRYRFHDLLRTFAREQAVTDLDERERRASLDGVLALYRDSASGWLRRARGEYQPDDDAVLWFDADGDNAIDAAEFAYEIGAWDIVTSLTEALGHLMTLRGRVSARERLLSLSAAAAASLGDLRAEAHFTVLLAELFMWSDRVDQTRPLYERALELSAQIEQGPAVRMWTLTHYGDALLQIGEPLAASRRYGEAYVLAGLGADIAGMAWVLTHWAGAQQELGRPDLAVMMYSRALEVGRARSDLGNVAWVLTHLARAFNDQSRFAEADTTLDQALAIMRGNDDLVGQEWVLGHTGDLLLRRSDPQAAATAYRRASEIAELRRDPSAVTLWLRRATEALTGQ